MKKLRLVTRPVPVEQIREWDLSSVASEGLLMIKAQRLRTRRWKKLRSLEA